ncbi:uncharacterized protein MEPE_02870 [Melanopsichium pennsylvanicum]|uniref:SET domain-containing protein n=2 Tax=Melanopsichium pennsylvanicum TaxID=63383 RepID=A0AAJ4XLR0_9BASI|nr:conserved hypothetical protein [Melanopsichium pennsylvanicum 4]SNX84162.1 uncharacterized protein MEPE_02870 [Melanopsichium pennsylvanicum]
MVEHHVPSLAEDQSPQIQSLLRYPTSTPHLNSYNLVIRDPGTGSGRGIYTSFPIPAETLIEISPVLLFPPNEYTLHGSKTQLDGYTFVWKKTSNGQAIMALALGLGSLFNHSKDKVNVKWMLDHEQQCIKYTTTRRVQEGEELCISYGAGRMWWEPELSPEEQAKEAEERRRKQDPDFEAMQFGRIGLSEDESEAECDEVPKEVLSKATEERQTKVANGIEVTSAPGPSRLNRPTASNYPPIYRLTAGIDPVTLPLATRDAWIIDIPPTSASLAVKFLQKHPSILQNRDDGLHSTRHLRSFRTTPTTLPDGSKKVRTQFLLCLHSAFPDRDGLMQWLKNKAGGIFGDEANPYLGKVPVIAAPTKERLPEWQAVWPCLVRTNPKELIPRNGGDNGSGPILLVDRKKDSAMWTEEPERLRWAENRFKRIVALARYALENAKTSGEEGGLRMALGSAVHVTHPFQTAKKFVPSSKGVGLNWQQRETECDWGQLTGFKAPVIGRIAQISTDAKDVAGHWESEKARIIQTLSMTEDQWAAFNSSTHPTRAAFISANTPTMGTIEIDALDRRLYGRNPLKHAAIEAVSRVSVLRTLDRTLLIPTIHTTPTFTETISSTLANGSDYLLTNLSLFTLYEPCIYCSMALLHSRVSEIYFLLPSPGRGGCCGSQLPKASRCEGGEDGGVYALQEQKGLNHSFTVWRWMADALGQDQVEELAIEFDMGLLDP